MTIRMDQVLGQLPTTHTMLGSKTDIFVCVISAEQLSHKRSCNLGYDSGGNSKSLQTPCVKTAFPFG